MPSAYHAATSLVAERPGYALRYFPAPVLPLGQSCLPYLAAGHTARNSPARSRVRPKTAGAAAPAWAIHSAETTPGRMPEHRSLQRRLGPSVGAAQGLRSDERGLSQLKRKPTGIPAMIDESSAAYVGSRALQGSAPCEALGLVHDRSMSSPVPCPKDTFWP